MKRLFGVNSELNSVFLNQKLDKLVKTPPNVQKDKEMWSACFLSKNNVASEDLLDV